MKLVVLSDIFEVKYGVNLELNKLEQVADGINFVSRTANNNGVSARVKLLSGVEPIPAGVLSVAGGGSVLSTFLQPSEFYSGRDLYYLKPRVELTTEQKLYCCLTIMANKFRYNYGRQANRTLASLQIPDPAKLPVWAEGRLEAISGAWRHHLRR